MPKTKAEAKAERTRLFVLFSEEFEDIRVLKLTGVRIELRFYNSFVTFECKDGRTQMIPTSRRLSTENYMFLFTFADMLMKAVREGYKKKRESTGRQAAPSGIPQVKKQLRLSL